MIPTSVRAWLLRLAGLFTRSRREREFDAELAAHLDLHIAENIRRGMSATDARRAALARLGGVQSVREQYRDRGGVRLLDDLASDVKYAARRLRRSPGFVVVALLTVAVGVAGPTVMFAMTKAWILDPLPFANPGSLLDVRNRDTQSGRTGPINIADFLDWRRGAQAVDLAAYRSADVRLTGVGRAERLSGAQATANFFQMLGVAAAIGRAFEPGDDEAARSRVAVISHAFARRQFGGEGALGRSLRLDGEDHTVVGVLPPEFQFTLLGGVDVWRPLVFAPEDASSRRPRSIIGLARLRAGRTIEDARAELSAAAERLAAAYADTNSRRSVRVWTLADEVRLHHDAGVIVPILLAMMCCVLIVACVNVTNVTLARARARTQEVAVRLALGASRARIIRQWLVEHVLVFVAASAVGTGLAKYGAVWVTNSIPAVNRQYLRNYAVLPIDGMTLTLALLTGAACGVVCGWLPAWASARTNVGADLREGSARTTAGRRGSRLRSALIVSEVAFTLALLVSAGLLIATARNVVKADVGFNPAALHTFELALDPRQHREPADVRAFYERVVAEIQRVPAVSQAAAGSLVPFGTSGSRTEFFVDGRPDTPPADTPQADSSAVTPAYASTLGLTLRRGRFLAAGDTADAPKVTVINELLASRHFAGRDPIGARLRFGRASTDTWTIVGVVADVRNYEVSDPTEPQVYLPFAQSPSRDATIVMRSSASPDVLLPLLRAAVARVDPQEPVLDPATMEQRIHRLTAGFQTVSTFVIFFGIVTLLLAGVGVYGVVSYTFAQRTREIGIRMALGARRVDVASLVFRQVRTLVLVGVVPGLALAWVLGEAMEAILFGVTPLDWRLYSAMTLLLTVTAAVAALLPARRAMRIDPTIALRYE